MTARTSTSLLLCLTPRYDNLFPPSSPASKSNQATCCRSLLSELTSLDRSSLNADQLVDLDLMISSLRLELLDLRQSQRDPTALLSQCFDSINLLVRQAADSPPTVSLHHRLSKLIPALLIDAKQTLEDQPIVWLQMAHKMALDLSSFLSSQARDKEDLWMTSAAMACQLYANHLSRFVVADKHEDEIVGVGRETMAEYVSLMHMIEFDGKGEGAGPGDVLDYLVSWAQVRLDEIEKKLEELAKEMDPSKTWVELTNDMKQVRTRTRYLGSLAITGINIGINTSFPILT